MYRPTIGAVSPDDVDIVTQLAGGLSPQRSVGRLVHSIDVIARRAGSLEWALAARVPSALRSKKRQIYQFAG
jgi:hypothetical protein